MPSLGYVSIGAVQPGLATGVSLGYVSIGAVQPYLTVGSLSVALGGATTTATGLTTVPTPASSTLLVALGGATTTATGLTTVPTPANSTLANSLGSVNLAAAGSTTVAGPSTASAAITLSAAAVGSAVQSTAATPSIAAAAITLSGGSLAAIVYNPSPAFAAAAITLSGGSLAAIVTASTFVSSPNTTYTGDDLIEAIWTYLDPLRADDFGKSGWLWRDEAARGQRLPYAVVFTVAASDTEIHSGDGYTYQIPVQLNVFGSKDDVTRLGDLIHDDLLPRKAGHSVFAWKQWYELSRWIDAGNMLEKDPDRGPDGSDVWIYRLHFTFLVARSFSR